MYTEGGKGGRGGGGGGRRGGGMDGYTAVRTVDVPHCGREKGERWGNEAILIFSKHTKTHYSTYMYIHTHSKSVGRR